MVHVRREEVKVHVFRHGEKCIIRICIRFSLDALGHNRRPVRVYFATCVQVFGDFNEIVFIQYVLVAS